MKGLKWHKVESSNIEKVAHDFQNMELYVKFKSGLTYSYIGVPHREFEKFMEAKSHGVYLNTKIKPNFDYRDWN